MDVCKHRGEQSGAVKVNVGRLRPIAIKKYECNIHGACVQVKTMPVEGVAVCNTCPDRRIER